MIECVKEILTIVGYVADVYACFSIPYTLYQHKKRKMSEKRYEKLLLSRYSETAKSHYLSLISKTQKKKDWYTGGGVDKIFKPIHGFLLDNIEELKLLDKKLQIMHDELLKRLDNLYLENDYPAVASDILTFLYEIRVYISNYDS